MKRSTILAITICALVLVANAQPCFAKSGRGGSGYKSSTSTRSSARPYYGGGYHTSSHGGAYIGGAGASHAGGKYSNPASGNRYGIHQETTKGASRLLSH